MHSVSLHYVCTEQYQIAKVCHIRNFPAICSFKQYIGLRSSAHAFLRTASLPIRSYSASMVRRSSRNNSAESFIDRAEEGTKEEQSKHNKKVVATANSKPQQRVQGLSNGTSHNVAGDKSKAKNPRYQVKGIKRKLESVKFEDGNEELPHGLSDLKRQISEEGGEDNLSNGASHEGLVNGEAETARESFTSTGSTKSTAASEKPSVRRAAKDDKHSYDGPPLKKTKRSSQKATPVKQTAATPTAKPKSKSKSYGLTPGLSPFPNYLKPTPTDCQDVYNALASLHGVSSPPKTIPAPSEIVAGCGEVPAILDAMIRTYLSSNTTGRNSSAAFQGLVKAFGTLKEGLGKGSVDWNAVRLATQEEVFEAIKHGGLGGVKSKTIKAILDMVYEENLQRRKAMDEPQADDPTGADAASKDPAAEKQLERMRLDQNVLSLDHYHSLSNTEAQEALTKFPGIGVKTSSCVMLFCMQRPSFAVDTHVFRLASWLGWIPDPAAPREKGEKRVDRDTAFSHLDVRIPDELKYGLHQLFIKHGKTCPRCRAITGEGSEGWEAANCPIEELVKRTGARKGVGGVTPNATPKKGGTGSAKKKIKMEDEDLKNGTTPSKARTSKSTPVKKKPTPANNRSSSKTTNPIKAELDDLDTKDSITTPRTSRRSVRTPVKPKVKVKEQPLSDDDANSSDLSDLDDDSEDEDNSTDGIFNGGGAEEEEEEEEEEDDDEHEYEDED